mgnify:CR=1 FL=1
MLERVTKGYPGTESATKASGAIREISDGAESKVELAAMFESQGYSKDVAARMAR